MIKSLINIIIYILFPSLIQIIFNKRINDNNLSYFLIMVLPYLILFIFFDIKYRIEIKKDIKKFNKSYFKKIIPYFIVGFILMILSNYIINYLIIPNSIAHNESTSINLLLQHKIMYTVLFCIIIPFLEEIIFRLEFKKSIKNKWLFISISSLTFAIIHIISITKFIELIYILPYLILGITFSNIYYKTNNIISNILAHSVHNTIIVIIYLFIYKY